MAVNLAVTPGAGAIVLTDEVTDATLGNTPAKKQMIGIVDATVGGTLKAAVTANGLSVDTLALTTVAAGTAPAKAVVSGMQYNSAAPTPTNGQTLAQQSDSAGNLKVTQAVALPAGTAIIGKVTTDQTTHGTTDLVAADITKINGAAVPVGHGVAATALRVELPSDGTGIVGLAAGTNSVGTVVTLADAGIGAGTAPAKSHIVGAVYNSAAPTLTNGQTAALQATSAGRLQTAAQLVDPSTGNAAAVQALHNADNQSVSSSQYGILTGGVAQLRNAANNLDRQRETGIDQQGSVGISSGAAQFAQEIIATSTTTVAAAAATATLSIANTAGFVVNGTLNFEPSFTNVAGTRYEPAVITAVVANTSVAVAFPAGGALFTHTQPYSVQTFLFNQERDFSGEGQSAQGIGAAIATEFESNMGGAPLASGLASGWTLDADRNIQGKSTQQMAITSTSTSDTSIVFTNNPWTSGLTVGAKLILSATANGAAVEEVIVSKNNLPSTGGGPKTVTIVNPVVTASSVFATFDSFGLNMPTTGATVQGLEDASIFLYDPVATDPKRPMKPLAMAPSHAGAALVSSDGVKTTYRYGSFNQTLYSTAAAVLLEIVGSATKTVRVKKITLWTTRCAAVFYSELTLLRCTGASAGTPTAVTAGKHDKNDGAATAVVNFYTAAATAGAGNAVIGAKLLPAPTQAAGVPPVSVTWDFCTNQDKALILRGTGDVIEVFNNTTGLTSAIFGFEVELEEDAS